MKIIHTSKQYKVELFEITGNVRISRVWDGERRKLVDIPAELFKSDLSLGTKAERDALCARMLEG